MAKPRPQLEAVLQRLLVVVIVVVVGGVPGFGFPFLRDLDPLRGWLRLGDEHFQVILQDTRHQRVYSKQGLLD
jgi:hypothetical protein